MKTDHTPEPWHSECATVSKDIGDHRYEVAICADWSEETFANARRIVACVNACAGIETELLEIIQDNDKTLAEVIANVEKQRDELLAFVEEVRRTGDTRLASMAITAIASVKEKA